MITNKYVWINRDVLNLNISLRKLGLMCRLCELMVEDGRIMEEDEKKPASKKYLQKYTGIGNNRFSRIVKDLVDAQIVFYDSESHIYSFNKKYVVLPSTKNKTLKNYIRLSCSNLDKLFPDGFDITFLVNIGYLLRVALHIGVIDNSIRDNIYCCDRDKFIYLGLDEIFQDYTSRNMYRIEAVLKSLFFKGKQCVEFYPDKIIVNPLLFNTTGIVIRNKKHNVPLISTGEELTYIFLKKYDINFETQKRFAGLVGLNGGELSYDFYLPDLNVLIECQGSQHYRISDHFKEEDFVKQREHDHRKWEYAKNNNIKLIELPYWHYNNVEEYLKLKIFS